MTIVYSVKQGLYVNLTNKCPCACEFCIRKNGDGAYGSGSLWLEHEPTAEETVAAIEAADVGKYKELVFCGYGEPTERLDALVEVAGAVRRCHPAVQIRVNTNGLSDLICGRPTAADFAGIVDVLSISLNAATAEEYCRLCHPKFGLDAFPAILKFAAAAKKHVPMVLLTVVATKDFTAQKLAACELICRRLGVPLRVRTLVG